MVRIFWLTASCLILVLLSSCFSPVVDDGSGVSDNPSLVWTKSADIVGGDFESVAFGNNMFLAVGSLFTNWVSSDGISWQKQPWKGNGAGSKIRFLNGEFFVLSYNGDIAHGSGTGSWAYSSVSSDIWLRDIAYGSGTYVIVGSSGTILVSLDGTTWSAVNTSSGITDDIRAVTYFNGTFIATCGWDTLLTSTDGIHWTTHNQAGFLGYATNDVTCVGVGESGAISYSSDGTTWNAASSGVSAQLNDVIFADSRYVAVGAAGAALTSTDGQTWTVRDTTVSDELRGIAYGNGTFVAVSRGGGVINSVDGINWEGEPDAKGSVRSISFLNGQYFITGNNGLVTKSSDLVTWSSAETGTKNDLRSITYGDGKYIAVGEAGTIVTSSNGNDWTDVVSGTGDDIGWVGFLNNQFVATAGGYLLVSVDGLNWNLYDSGTSDALSTVAYGNGIYVAVFGGGGGFPVGGNRIALTSPNGIDWTARDLGRAGCLSDVVFKNGTFFAVDYFSGDLEKSSDGITWSVVDTQPYSGSLWKLVAGDDIAVSLSGVDVGVGVVKNLSAQEYQDYYGPDFRNGDDSWTGYQRLVDMIYAEGRFVAVGESFVGTVTLP